MKALELLAKQNPLYLAGGVVLIIGAIYYFGRQGVKDAAAGIGVVASAAAETVAGVATGHNAITESATNAQGVPVSAYEGAGIFGTYGAAVNAALGGVPASIGQGIGGLVYRQNEYVAGLWDRLLGSDDVDAGRAPAKDDWQW